MAGKSVQPRFSPAVQGYEGKALNLNAQLIKDPPATFVVQIDVDNMIDVGILPGSKVLVNRAKASKAKTGDIVLAVVDHEFVISELYKRGKVIRLLSNNKAMDYLPIELTEGQQLMIWGVVEHGINRYI
ncbi:LexA family protein [Methylophilus sp.]|uniref:LexA family protein n=1 Tax=Methylophilus sp. TaxID=29541 RepID=UPI0040365F5B